MFPPTGIRIATAADAEPLVSLIGELGYAAGDDVLRANLDRLAEGQDDRVWVAEVQGRIVGLVSVHLTPLFHAAGFVGRITSLVVHSSQRRRGVGRSLIAVAEDFCWSSGCHRIELTSGDHRPDAHHFYEMLGYRSESRLFRKHRR